MVMSLPASDTRSNTRRPATRHTSASSVPDEPGDRLGRLPQLLLRVRAARLDRSAPAEVEMVIWQAECDRLQCTRHCSDLGEDVDAVLLLVDHLVEASSLSLNPAQALDVIRSCR
jgi:hypothetical protein